jgi:hypothetical protein
MGRYPPRPRCDGRRRIRPDVKSPRQALRGGAKGLGSPFDQPLFASADVRQQLQDATQHGKPSEKAHHCPGEVNVLGAGRRRGMQFRTERLYSTHAAPKAVLLARGQKSAILTAEFHPVV